MVEVWKTVEHLPLELLERKAALEELEAFLEEGNGIH
jgi:hypothetical protein